MVDELTVEEAKEYLVYNKITGAFYRLKAGSGYHSGDVAGHVNTLGYCIIKIKGKAYKAHRLAWLFCHDEWPTKQIDHIDGNKLNNKITNLRDVSTMENCGNRKIHRSGHLVGTRCYKCKGGDRWRAIIRKGAKRVYLGTYDTPEEAHKAYLLARKKLVS